MAKKRIIDVDSTTLEKAKATALALSDDTTPDILKIFSSDNLEIVEQGIRKLNEYSATCWLLSALTLHTLIYDNALYTQSGLTWENYLADSRKRTGLSKREVTEQLSSARFFIAHYNDLVSAGWTPIESSRKMARAELAYKLSGNLNETIQHLVNDSWREFKDWYQSFKELPDSEFNNSKSVFKKEEIKIQKRNVTVRGEPAIYLSDDLTDDEKKKLQGYINKLFEALSKGYEPAIVDVYDESEAKRLVVLRDKDRRSR